MNLGKLKSYTKDIGKSGIICDLFILHYTNTNFNTFCFHLEHRGELCAFFRYEKKRVRGITAGVMQARADTAE
jgi:hypothetical protein